MKIPDATFNKAVKKVSHYTSEYKGELTNSEKFCLLECSIDKLNSEDTNFYALTGRSKRIIGVNSAISIADRELFFEKVEEDDDVKILRKKPIY